MNIREYKERYKLSTLEVARRLGVSPASILNWIKGSHIPHERTRKRISKKTKGEIGADEWNFSSIVS